MCRPSYHCFSSLQLPKLHANAPGYAFVLASVKMGGDRQVMVRYSDDFPAAQALVPMIQGFGMVRG